MPALAASTDMIPCQWEGVAMCTMSTSGSWMRSRKSWYALGVMFHFALAASMAESRCFWSTSHSATMRQRSSFTKCRSLRPMPPTPIMPRVSWSLGAIKLFLPPIFPSTLRGRMVNKAAPMAPRCRNVLLSILISRWFLCCENVISVPLLLSVGHEVRRSRLKWNFTAFPHKGARCALWQF